MDLFHQRLKHQNNYFLYKSWAFFLFSSTVCILYIRVYDCFSVWSQKLEYEFADFADAILMLLSFVF